MTSKNSLARRMQYIGYAIWQLMQRSTHQYRVLDTTTIVFEAYAGKQYACSPRALYETMLIDERFSEYTFVWAFDDPSKYEFLLDEPRTRIVKHGSKEYYRAYNRAKYWIVNCRIPLSIAKRDEQVMLQCWHGTPLKHLRHDIVQDSVAAMDSVDDLIRMNKLDTSRYDYFISPSTYASEKFTKAFDLTTLHKENILIETGYPRNDYLVNHTAQEVRAIKKKLGIPVDKKVLLYAPTWRDDQYNSGQGYYFASPIDFSALQDALGDEYVVLFRLHHYVADNFDFSRYKGFVYDVSNIDDIRELYVISDVLMTDYSSVIFDFANLQRPILFFMYDKDHYENELRGLYLTPKDLPGDVVTTQAQVVDRLQLLDEYQKKTAPKLSKFHKKFNYLDDGQAAKRVIDIIWMP